MLLSMKDINKSFSGVSVLRDASLEVAPGEVMALIGQNGAGKSTMIKILTGAYRKDSGSIQFDGTQVDFSAPAGAQAAGIATVYQELNLAPHRTVAENIFLSREPRRWGLLDRRRMRAEASRVLARFKLELDVDRPLEDFSAATRQMVAIARGVTQNARLVIMDEPTSSLDEREVGVLFDTIRTLKADGVSTLFVSHRLSELYAVCDRVTIMRDGRTIGQHPMSEISRVELVRSMLGRELTAFATRAKDEARGSDLPVFLHAEDLHAGTRVRGVSLQVRRGEIAGLAGLLGAGRTETARLIFGADPRDGGRVAVEGRETSYREPVDAIRDGIGLVSEDRKVEGIVPELSVRENMTLAILPKLRVGGVVDRTRERAIVDRFIKALGVKCSSPEQPIRELSGGNQQKVLLARWLCTDPNLLIVDEPTRGIDVGAKAEILKLLRELADDGLSVLMISSELEELMAAADHVTVLSDGQSVAVLAADELSEERLMTEMAHQNEIGSEGARAA
ncbi:sugar ABC transporter ATP-binding protein [Mesorhizobium sp. RP14(2022)]|uniref:Sugar ABC transporter ATP-binding protein n=1 Tax=Mesorhizobium liriopis TaxID=2953882 RepID=A0ABT1CBL9_9HYPH|nr:sugar ABC transporter ATP-binding protein [Mesorhizobium liriopis]MCO6052218.1 sugar ABC transporter ATP-binding protein [Mesorhizobium liriopis]